jgi:hypothetical protein
MSTCNWLELQTLGSQPVMPKNLPDHWCHINKKPMHASFQACQCSWFSVNCLETGKNAFEQVNLGTFTLWICNQSTGRIGCYSSYRWTGWVWEISDRSSGLQENHPSLELSVKWSRWNHEFCPKPSLFCMFSNFYILSLLCNSCKSLS